MTPFLIILSCLLWIAACALMGKKILLSPGLSYLALVALSFAKVQGYPLLPINNVILTGWLCMTVIVMLIVIMQAPGVRNASRGVGYMAGGALTGMAVGLLGYTFTPSLALCYGIMIVATASGTFFGFLIYSNTPKGQGIELRSGNFFKYLLAKGFPVAITAMQLGVALTLLIAVNSPESI